MTPPPGTLPTPAPHALSAGLAGLLVLILGGALAYQVISALLAVFLTDALLRWPAGGLGRLAQRLDTGCRMTLTPDHVKPLSLIGAGLAGLLSAAIGYGFTAELIHAALTYLVVRAMLRHELAPQPAERRA